METLVQASLTYAPLFEALSAHGFDPTLSVISNTKHVFSLPKEQQEEIKGLLIARNFSYHFEHNAFYQESCLSKGVTPAAIQTFEDLIKIPLIPVRKFKETTSHQLLSTGFDKIEFEMRSTGTSGIPSVSRRDSKTVTDAVLSLSAMYREFFSVCTGAILYLMPSTEDIPEMGMIKVLNILSGLTDANRYVVKNHSFRSEDALDALQQWENKHTRHIVGPPFLVYRFIKYLKAKGLKLKLDRNTKIINLGGWKMFTGSEIPRAEYNRDCAEYLGIAEHQIRDMYGLVEANSLAIECEHHNKHVSPWVHYSVRDLNDLSKEVAEGERGVLAILEPTSTSYPTFILTEDLVYLKRQHACTCGRNSQQVVYISRVRGAEIGCCAINLERQMDEAEAKVSADQGSCIIA